MAGRDPVGNHEAGQKVKKRFAITRELSGESGVIFLVCVAGGEGVVYIPEISDRAPPLSAV
jgi:hypothetical protein